MKTKLITPFVNVREDATDLGIKIGDTFYSVRKFMETYLYIQNKKGEKVKLKFNDAQEKLFFEICKRLRDGKPAHFIILKARQLGFTTFISAFLFVFTFFLPNRVTYVIANTLQNAQPIFSKYDGYYKELNVALQPTLERRTQSSMKTKNGKSSLTVAVASDNAVRGTTISGFHGSEVAFWENMQETLVAVRAAIPSIKDNPLTFFFLESTANGFNDFKDYWDVANEEGEASPYKPLFFPWFDNPEYQLDYDGFTLTKFEKERMEEYHLTYNQIAYFRARYLEYKKDLQFTLQEFPFCPSDAFVSTGFGVFNNSLIAKRKDEVRKIPFITAFFDYRVRAINNDIDDWKMEYYDLVESEAGTIKVFEKVKKGVPYVIGVDMATGLGNDSSVAFVIRNDTKEEVAIMESNSTPSEQFATELFALGSYYNNALIGVETNASGGGLTALRTLKKLNYDNLYIREGDVDEIGRQLGQSYGVKTTVRSKPLMIDCLKEMCGDDYSNIKDYGTLNQMEIFVYDYGKNNERKDNPKIKGQGNAHDDRVMASAIAYFISEQQTSLVRVEHKINQKKIPWQLRDDEVEEEHSTRWESIYQ